MPERDLDSNYIDNWDNEANQCKQCASFQAKNGHSVCMCFSDKTFEENLEINGEISPEGHCDYFQSLD
jgi:hypothetical protein